jgi:hypothetical protein
MESTQTLLPTSLAFAATWRRCRAQRPPEQGRPQRNTLVLMGEFNGCGLVQQNTIIEVGDRVYFENSAAKPDDGGPHKVVAAIDKETRAMTGEWLVIWAQVPARREGAIAAAVVLDAQRFLYVMLIWAYQNSDEGKAGIDLADFAPNDVPLDCVLPLADRLCDSGDLRRSGSDTVAYLTAKGIRAAHEAAALRGNRTRRTEALQNGIIRWIYDNEEPADGDWYIDLRDFLHDPRAVFYGRFFTENEVASELAYLVELELLHEPHTTWWYWPTLTAKGRNCAAYYGGNVHDYLNKPQTDAPKPTVTISGGTNNVAFGPEATQTINTGPSTTNPGDVEGKETAKSGELQPQEPSPPTGPTEQTRGLWPEVKEAVAKAWQFTLGISIIATGILTYLIYLLARK